MADYEEFEIAQGTDVTIELHLTNEDGTKKDLSSHTMVGTIKKNYSDSAGEATLFATLFATPNTSGIANLTLTNTQTAALSKGRHVYDVELNFIDSDGNTVTERILEGRINVTPSVS